MADTKPTGGQNTPGTSNTDDANNPGAETELENEETQDGQEPRFTQGELDNIVKKRLAKERARWEKDKDLSELDRYKAENEELRKTIASQNAFNEFETAAAKQGVRNVRGLYRAISSDITLDKDGKIDDLQGLLKAAKNELPEFFATANLGGGDGDTADKNGSKTVDMNSLIRRGFGFH